ncbi:MAG: addiction module antitoxin [Elusimicrobia bacterium RIFCSPLOWO2_02_FULL_39_32]|nr:MAG: addiction module antitoxin [Elusimicrobia bacterium GWA2_38_7]OGR79479.1 MAG: addiction module antitoxin [Elusimicrobia bacterium RIFCSPHIGHO2_02_FULL_39_36]OGR92806.1 MAG: addiction module antitoxin [Elusimicrobia bacterium RIFCSPLOWO2_02_FULL_39_32]OGR99590.1 MAG: addiction module antitoxin [Elusimicrobia bacterium RIFCSPLOWO2_12_FULL_39_28]
MASYKVLIKRSAEKELRLVPKIDLTRIVSKVQSLSIEPRPHGCEKLSGEEKYRIRQGDWRIVYSINDTHQTIEIVKVGHRREIYRI